MVASPEPSHLGDRLHYYDTLDDHEQAAVRAKWAAQITELRENLDLAETFEAEGRP